MFQLPPVNQRLTLVNTQERAGTLSAWCMWQLYSDQPTEVLRVLSSGRSSPDVYLLCRFNWENWSAAVFSFLFSEIRGRFGFVRVAAPAGLFCGGNTYNGSDGTSGSIHSMQCQFTKRFKNAFIAQNQKMIPMKSIRILNWYWTDTELTLNYTKHWSFKFKTIGLSSMK